MMIKLFSGENKESFKNSSMRIEVLRRISFEAFNERK
jgi:hypothetical protein